MFRLDETSEDVERLGVADAKARFSELLDRIDHGEAFMIARHGKVIAKLGPPDESARASEKAGLLTIAGALDDWSDFDRIMKDVVASRRHAKDRPAPTFD